MARRPGGAQCAPRFLRGRRPGHRLPLLTGTNSMQRAGISRRRPARLACREAPDRNARTARHSKTLASLTWDMLDSGGLR